MIDRQATSGTTPYRCPFATALVAGATANELLERTNHNMKTYTGFRRWMRGLGMAMPVLLLCALAVPGAQAQAKKPNILVIWGDDIGTWNISFNSRGMMGYKTPNIDRLAKEGLSFTDYYGQQSCTAGRAAFISGAVPVRSGMTKVGLPGAKEGWQKTDVTMA